MSALKCPRKPRTRFFGLSVLVALAIGACGGEPPPAPAAPEVKAPPPPAPTPAPAPSATPQAPPENTKPPAAETPSDSSSAERPPVLMSSEKELQAVFTTSPGAKLELGDDTGRAVFRIREGTLPSPYVISFKIEPKGKTTGAPIGKIYRTIVQLENSGDLPTITTEDKPFELTLPAGNKKDANLAIGNIEGDGKKITWTIIAPEKIDDAMGTAFFKLKTLGNYYLHVTAKPPTEPK